MLKSKGMMGAGVVALSSAMILNVQAFAQDEPDDVELIEEVEEADDDGDTVVVTGSRLRRDEFSTISPLQVIDGEVARDLGLIDAQSLLTQSSVISGQQNTVGVSTAFNGGLQQAFTTIGNVSPSLRGLGSSVTGRSRSLVLVNGRRLGPIGVGGAPANVDISLIPGSLVERTDILLDGASSVYGSDAVAGVINFVLRDDFDGLELSAFKAGNPERGWGTNSVYSLTTGVSSERGFMGFAIEYNQQEEIEKIDILRDFWGPVADVQSTLPDQFCTSSVSIIEATGELRERCDESAIGFAITGIGNIVGENLSGDLTPVTGAPGFFLRPGSFFRETNDPTIQGIPQTYGDSYLPETQRLSIYTTGDYELGLYGDMTAFWEASYGERQLAAQATTQEVLPFSADNPFNPFGVGGLFVYGAENPVTQDIGVFRGAAGIRGDIPDFKIGSVDNVSYEVHASFHRSNGTQTRTGFLNEDRIAQGLNSFVDADTGQITCESPGTDPDTGGTVFFGFNTVRAPITCIPLNPFVPEFLTDGQFATEQQNDFAYGSLNQETIVEQQIISGFMNADLFDIPSGGTAQFLAGGEFRIDSVETISSDTTRNGLLQGIDADIGSTGERWIREGFFELSLPLVEGKKYADSVLVEGAARWTEEENSGAAWTYRVRGEYAPVSYLTARAGYGTSFRAPDTGEQFGTGTIFVQPSRADPCIVSGFMIDPVTALYDASLDTRSQVLLDNCVALGLDPTTLGTVGQGDPSTLAFVSNPVAFGNFGNIATGPEESKAWFAGLVLDQPWFDQFDLQMSATYYDYVIEGSIGQLTRGQILSECFESIGLTDPLCAFQERDASGNLTAVNEASINLGETTARGFDVNVRFDYEFDKLMFKETPLDFSWDLTATQSLENTEDVLGDGNITDNLGDLTLGGGFPQTQAVSTLTFGWKDWTMLWRTRYISDLFNVGERGNAFDPCFVGSNVDFDDSALDQLTDQYRAVLDSDVAGEDGQIYQVTDPTTPDGYIDTCFDHESTEAYWQNDVTLVYRADTWSLRAGVTNVFDEVQKLNSDITQYNVPISAGHDIFGRRGFIQITKTF